MGGLIDGFNKSSRKISIGVGKKTGELMSAIRFWTIPKGDFPHYYIISRKTDQLGAKLNNAVCSSLITIFYLEIKKGKEAMKASYFQQHIGGTADCMNIIMKSTKVCDQLSSNDTFFADSKFRGVKTV